MIVEWKKTPEKERGVLVACDAAQEWLLPWWWENYHAENAFPITFVDFGMSEEARLFCCEKGECVSERSLVSFVTPKEDVDPSSASSWEDAYGIGLWAARPIWFKKPFALLHAPYERALWIDLDCEVLGKIDSLFMQCTAERPLALVREHATEHLPCLHPDVRYNGGVIAFLHGAAIIEQWASHALSRNHCFWSDDALLSALIYEERLSVVELPELYNWRLAQGVNLNAVIHHWCGSAGKAYIKHYGGIKSAVNQLFSTK